MSVIVTLAELKTYTRLTFTARDVEAQQKLDLTEGEILGFCQLPADPETVYAAHGERGLAQLKLYIIMATSLRLNGPDEIVDIWKGGWLARGLLPFRVPAFSSGTTA